MAWTLCTKEDVIGIHPCRDEDLKDQWSEMVEAMIRQHLGAPYLGTTQAITDELHSGNNTTIMQVKSPPIVSVTSVSVSGVALTAADYAVFGTYIQLYAQVFTSGILNVKISYVSGLTEIPQQVRLCAAAMVIAIYNYSRRRGADASIKWGDPDRRMGEETPNLTVGLTSHLDQIMKRTLRLYKLRIS